MWSPVGTCGPGEGALLLLSHRLAGLDSALRPPGTPGSGHDCSGWWRVTFNLNHQWLPSEPGLGPCPERSGGVCRHLEQAWLGLSTFTPLGPEALHRGCAGKEALSELQSQRLWVAPPVNTEATRHASCPSLLPEPRHLPPPLSFLRQLGLGFTLPSGTQSGMSGVCCPRLC